MGEGRRAVFYSAVLWVAAVILIIFYVANSGLFRPFFSTFDQDLVLIPQALVFNDNLSQTYFDHPGYLTILALSAWLRSLQWFGLIPLSNLSQFAQSPDLTSSLNQLVIAGRCFSLVCCLFFLGALALSTWLLTRNRLLVAVAIFLVLVQRGLLFQSMTIRTELLAWSFALVSLSLLLQGVTSSKSEVSALYLLGCGFFAYLSMIAKVQAALFLIWLPLLPVFFSRQSAATRWRPRYRHMLVFALLVFSSVYSMVFFEGRTFPSGLPWYHAVFLLWVLMCASLFLTIKGRVACYLLWVFSATAGFINGFGINYFHYDIRNHHIVMSWLEHLTRFSLYWKSPPAGACSMIEPECFISKLQYSVRDTLSDLALGRSHYDLAFLVIFWVTVSIVIWASYKRFWGVVQRSALLLGVALFLQCFFMFRWVNIRAPSFTYYYALLPESLMVLSFVCSYRPLLRVPGSRRWAMLLTAMSLVLGMYMAPRTLRECNTHVLTHRSPQELDALTEFLSVTPSFLEIIQKRGGVAAVVKGAGEGRP